ncbi:hypothetical protein [Anaplasma platys]|uniref:hypothetical protein n=1 Tax=Anaplasma platys TaxID=949 RepID=UPI00145CB93E|nr:hypothetical protein [Anaplasma platys]
MRFSILFDFNIARSDLTLTALCPTICDAQQTSKKEEEAARAGSPLSERAVFLDVSTQKVQESEAKAASESSVSRAATITRSISPVRLLETKKKAPAVKPPVAPKSASVAAATFTPAQRAMHAFSSFASLASTSAETKQTQPATFNPVCKYFC